jgi:hypothetical protein
VTASSERSLLQRNQVLDRLELSDDELNWLIKTQQLVDITICGQQRFDSKDIDLLIDAYRCTAQRRVN